MGTQEIIDSLEMIKQILPDYANVIESAQDIIYDYNGQGETMQQFYELKDFLDTAKHPVRNDRGEWVCPNCGQRVYVSNFHCCNCGKRLK